MQLRSQSSRELEVIEALDAEAQAQLEAMLAWMTYIDHVEGLQWLLERLKGRQ